MLLKQHEIKTILDWVLEMENRIFSTEERELIERLIENHAEINEQVQIEEMKHEVEEMIKSLNKRKRE